MECRDSWITTGIATTSSARSTFLILAIAIFLLVSFSGTPTVALAQAKNEPNPEKKEAGALDCSDFTTKRSAQSVLSQSLFSTEKDDRFRLDSDNDGIACETPQNSRNAEDGTILGASTGGDLDCMDFPSQKAAQKHLRNNPSDPNGLDPETNGIACEITSAPYEDHDFDDELVIAARSDADLDCKDFEYQQEAQAIYDRDESDPNRLDKQGNEVACESLPLLESNVEELTGENEEAESGLLLPIALIQAWPHGGGFGLLLDISSLMLVAGGGFASFVLWRRREQR